MIRLKNFFIKIYNLPHMNMDKKTQIEVCMKDAGMDTASIEACLQCFQAGEVGCGRKKLYEYRTKLLSEIQTKQKQLNCLDYLIESDYVKKLLEYKK